MPPSRRAARSARWLLWPVAALVALGVVGDASYAAFVSKVSNAGNSLAAGSVTLTDDDTGQALFTATNLKPGSTGSRCVTVTSTGTLPSTVKLYGNVSTTAGFSTYLNLTVTQGTGGSYSSCTGFAPLASGATVYNNALASLPSTYGTGVGNWTPSGTATETRTFQVAYTVNANTPDTAQGGTATFGLTWEAQNS